MWFCRGSKEDFDTVLEEILAHVRDNTCWKNFDYSLNHLSSLGRQFYGVEAVEVLVRTLGSTVVTPHGDHALAGTSHAFGLYRDRVLLRSIISFLERGERVFVCYGRGHLIRKRRAIEALFDSYQLLGDVC